jgi:hypothetical protein
MTDDVILSPGYATTRADPGAHRLVSGCPQRAALPYSTFRLTIALRVAVVPGGVLKPGEEIPLAGKQPAGGSRPPRTPIPSRYHQTATSGLTAEVQAWGNPSFDFVLTE